MEPMQVAVRLRPLVQNEINSGCRPCIERIAGQPQIIVGNGNNQQHFSFDYVFDDSDGQRKIYDSCVQPLISKLFEGYNVTILAYGQTGTGKTYTMGTNYSGSGSMGIIPRAIIEIFDKINSLTAEKCEVTVSFLELYNEVLYDLLTSKDREQSEVEIRETGNSLIIPGLTHKDVQTADRAMEVLHEGSSLRVTGATAMNATSSRSHAVFTVSLKITPVEDPKASVLSKFHLVDLAGSERAKKTEASGDRFKEGVNINKGLLVLGNVISQLGGGNVSYINYRDSKLTRLLQDSLGGNSYTLMIACISPADTNQKESLCTLRYADRVKKIKNKPVINVDPQAAMITQLKKEVEELRLQIISPGTGSSCPPSHRLLEEKLLAEMKRNSELSSALKAALQQNPALYERSLMIESVNEKTRERMAELTNILKKAVADPSSTTFKDLLDIVESIQGDHVQTEKDIIDHSRREQEDEINHPTNENHLEPPNEVKEQHVLFQAKTNREIETITKNLILKQDLYEQLQKNSGQLAELNDSGHSLEYLTNLVKKLESEKQALLMKKKTTRLRTPGNTHDVGTPENIQQRLHQLENELQKAQKKLQEQEKLLKFKAKSDEKIVNLRKEIQSMKSMKVQLIHQMRQENERFRNWQNEKNREMCKLRNINARQSTQISKMEKEFSLRQAVLRRKLETAAAAKKRMEQAFDRRNTSCLKKAKDFEPDKLDEYITAEIDVHDSISYAKKSLQNLLDDRSSLMKEINSIKELIADPKNTLTPEDLKSYEKKKAVLHQEAELQSTQIADLQQKIMNSRQDERKKQRWDGIKSIIEAKHALCFLFNSVSKSKKDVMNLNDVTKELKAELEEKIKEIDELQCQLRSSQNKNKKKCDDIVREYEDKIFEILSQRNKNKHNEVEEEEDSLPLQNYTLDNSKRNQSVATKRRTSFVVGSNLPSYEAEYYKFLETKYPLREEVDAEEDENTPPPEKKSRRPDVLDETFVKSPSSNEHRRTFEMPKRDRKFFDDDVVI